MGLNISQKKWWETDAYLSEHPIPTELDRVAGPSGLALVKVHSNGTTQTGWGEAPPKNDVQGGGFIQRYGRGEFSPNRAMYSYINKDTPFAFVMRSMRAMCVDIDGKNGGIESARRLGPLPATLAEISKSGTGFHLFYETPEEWLDDKGFSLIPDQIGITQGVDIRGTGCVYHYHAQRWNTRELAPLPEWLKDRLLEKQARREASKVAMQKISTLDEMERLMAHDELFDELAKPIKAGTRNTTLFAIGAKLMQAGVDDWEKRIQERALALGLDLAEIEKILENIARYGASQ